jgi:nucleoside-diphosphate-sugar epimerase
VSKTILVTGALGAVGQATMRLLTSRGYHCVATDVTARWAPDQSGKMTTRRADLRDLGSVIELMHGLDAVVHTANIPVASFESDHTTFLDNVTMNWNIFHAASLLGIERVVWLSSSAVFGLPFEHHPPAYLPLDDDHPHQPESAYALSKSVSEQVAAYFAGLGRTSYLGLRAALVLSAEKYEQYAAGVIADSQRIWSLWSHIALDELARACAHAIEADTTGSVNITITDSQSASYTPSTLLAAEYFPTTPQRWPVGSDTHASLHDPKNAQDLLGFESTTRWRAEPTSRHSDSTAASNAPEGTQR